MKMKMKKDEECQKSKACSARLLFWSSQGKDKTCLFKNFLKKRPLLVRQRLREPPALVKSCMKVIWAMIKANDLSIFFAK